MSPRALVTGGAGFIGSHLAEELLATGWWVDVLDNLSTGRKHNLAAMGGHPGLTFIEGSATDEATLARLIPQADVVFHLAAAVGVRPCVRMDSRNPARRRPALSGLSRKAATRTGPARWEPWPR